VLAFTVVHDRRDEPPLNIDDGFAESVQVGTDDEEAAAVIVRSIPRIVTPVSMVKGWGVFLGPEETVPETTIVRWGCR
jgi:hypothetical protein